MQKLRNQTTETTESLTKQGPYTIFDTKEFCRLRDALVCRLTLFNARRGGEASRMTLEELQDALNDKWIDKSKAEGITDEIGKRLLCETKVAYIRASKVAKLVPVLLPQDCFKALKIISDSDVRKSAGVHPSNDFAFPNTKLSLSHVTGWDCVDRLCREAKLDKNINATGMRHYIATEYALLDVSQSDRELFYKHMGHSESMNEHIYQCPPAVKNIINESEFSKIQIIIKTSKVRFQQYYETKYIEKCYRGSQ